MTATFCHLKRACRSRIYRLLLTPRYQREIARDLRRRHEEHDREELEREQRLARLRELALKASQANAQPAEVLQ